LEPVDLHELPLERRRDIVRDGLGRGARVVRVHLDDRVVHRGQVVDRQRAVGDHAENDHRDGQDRGHDRTANEGLGEVHGLPPALLPAAGVAGAAGAALASRTLPPGVTPSWPLTTTFSPGLTPSSMTTRSPCAWPVLTSLSSAVESSFTT